MRVGNSPPAMITMAVKEDSSSEVAIVEREEVPTRKVESPDSTVATRERVAREVTTTMRLRKRRSLSNTLSRLNQAQPKLMVQDLDSLTLVKLLKLRLPALKVMKLKTSLKSTLTELSLTRQEKMLKTTKRVASIREAMRIVLVLLVPKLALQVTARNLTLSTSQLLKEQSKSTA